MKCLVSHLKKWRSQDCTFEQNWEQFKLSERFFYEIITFDFPPDYIRNGTQMHFAVAIDFTASNGRHSHPSSLHYLSPERQNFYEIAIRGVGEIVQHYNSSQLFPAFGLYS